MDTRCSLEDLSEAVDDRDEWRENQGNLRLQRDLMMMFLYIYIYIYIYVYI